MTSLPETAGAALAAAFDAPVASQEGRRVVSASDLNWLRAGVLGANPRPLEAIDVRRVRGSIVRNGKTEQEGEASAVLGNPVTSVAWLANKLGEFGVTFEPGHVILTGSFVRAFPVKAGDDIVCRFDQGLGDVATQFT